MSPIIEVDKETMNKLNPAKYVCRVDLEKFASQIAELDRSNWIVVPYEFTDGEYSLEMNPARISYCPAVKKVAKELNKDSSININYKDTSEDSLGRGFVGNNTWAESLMLCQFLGIKTPNLKEEVDYLHLLYLGSKNKIKIYDVSGKQINSKLCKKLLMDSIGIQSPWRANWIDADYKKNEKNLRVNSDYIFNKKGIITSYTSEVLDENTLMKNPRISLKNWLEDSTKQGLPKNNVKSGDLGYWCPRGDNYSVARFNAGPIYVELDCHRSPFSKYAGLGVKAAKLRE